MTGLVITAFLLLVALAVTLMQGCSGSGGSTVAGGGGDGGGSTPGKGTLNVAFGNAAVFEGLSSVHVKVVKLVAVPAGKETAPLNDPGLVTVADYPDGQDFDLTSTLSLGSAQVPSGNYTQIRMVIAGNPQSPPYNNYYIASGRITQMALTTPGEGQNELVINKSFTVVANQENRVILAFDDDPAVGKRSSGAQYNLKRIPIVEVFTSFVNSGSITGTVKAPSFANLSSAIISVRPRNPDGATVASGIIFNNFSSSTGWEAPFIAFVPPNGSAQMPSANYRLFIWPGGSTFKLYSSPLITVTSKGQNFPVPPNGQVVFAPAQ